MLYTTELTEDYMGIVHTGSGVVTGAELLEACKSTRVPLQNPESFHYEFIDFSEASDRQVTPPDLDQMRAHFRGSQTWR